MERVLIDTGIWYAMHDKADAESHRGEAEAKVAQFHRLSLVVPWPTMYETLRTSFVRKKLALASFERTLKGPNVEFVDDAQFRANAFDMAIESSLRGRRPLSMVDCLIRLLLDDSRTSIKYLATLNARDFVDICKSRRIQLL